MAYRLIVLLDDGITSQGANAIAEEIQADWEGDVISAQVHEIEPGRPQDD